jgi:hypothetical protein
MQMPIARQTGAPTGRRNRLVLVGLVMAVLLVWGILTSIAQLRRSSDDSASRATLPSRTGATTASSSTISTASTAEEVLVRFKEIFRIRDQAIRTRNPLLLDEIYTVDCPCLKGDQQLIRKLRQERLLWRGVEISLDVQDMEKVNNRLWTATALVTTSPFQITTESDVVVRRVPKGQEFSRFALARPTGTGDWLLGQASVIEARD